MALTKHLDLRGGHPCWTATDHPETAADPLPDRPVDVAIIGAGVSGAMIAEALTAQGRSVALLDRRPPSQGATAASTALVMWAADTPLTELAGRIGPVEAARRWRRVHRAIEALDDLVERLAIDCTWRDRPELYLAGDVLDPSGLRAEAAARRAAGLPSSYLEAEATAECFGVPARAALLSNDSREVDPVALTLGLLAAARARGATATFPADVTDVVEDGAGVRLTLADGSDLRAGQAVLASGYELAPAFRPPGLELNSSFAIATAPSVAPLWGANALIWEACDPYLYARVTPNGRIIIGGEDEDFCDAAVRDALIPAKRAALERKGAAMLGVDWLIADCAWAATFGFSPDGLPVIGRARGLPALWIANGFGGNGVTFAMLAAQVIAADLAQAPDPDAACFDPWRFA